MLKWQRKSSKQRRCDICSVRTLNTKSWRFFSAENANRFKINDLFQDLTGHELQRPAIWKDRTRVLKRPFSSQNQRISNIVQMRWCWRKKGTGNAKYGKKESRRHFWIFSRLRATVFTLESHPENLQAWEHRAHYMWIWVQLPKPWIGGKIFLLEAAAWGLYRVFQPFVNVGHGINSIWALSEAFARMCDNAQIRFYAVKADVTESLEKPW